MPHPQTTLIGTVIDGKYGLEDLLGHGGMGAVYRAMHLGTGRPVAVKLLLPQWTGDAEAVARFRREARASGALRHPNVVDVTDFGVSRIGDQDVAYLVMELLEGSTLRDLLASRGPLPLELVVDITEQIAAALEAAHRAGIVHRDLKPDNIWLVQDARGGLAVRVLDFGIALVAPCLEPADIARVERSSHASVEDAADAATGVMPSAAAEVTAIIAAQAALPSAAASSEAPESYDHDVSARLTSAGSVVGTPYYMSPEQCQGLPVGPASDIYSLGVLVWEALSGFKPFRGSRDQVIHAHLQREPPPIDSAKPDVSAAVLRAMAKPATERFQSARAFAGCLRTAAEGPWVILRRCIALYANRFPEMIRVSWHCARWPVLAAILLLVVALALWWSGVVPRPENPKSLLWAAAGVTLVAATLWGLVTVFANATFALAVERLRTRPLDNLDAADLAAELRQRLGLPPSASHLRTTIRLNMFYVGCELRSKAGAGDLAFLIGLLERANPADVPQRCALLATGSRHVYRRLIAAIYAGICIPLLLEAGVLGSVLRHLGTDGTLLTIAICATLVPLNAMFVNPITSSALALLYFRARQAQGEDVALSAVFSGRL